MTHPSAKACRFVLLHHRTTALFSNETGRGDHFDLMIERPQRALLTSWAFEANPLAIVESFSIPSGSDAVFSGRQVADHRKDYLTYEGPVSGDRGVVKRLLAGACDWIEHKQTRSVVSLQWQRYQCKATLELLDDDLVQMTVEVV